MAATVGAGHISTSAPESGALTMSTGAQMLKVPSKKPRGHRGPSVRVTAAASAILPYLPPVLLDALGRHHGHASVWIDAVDGTLVFADISGFSQMSERLAEVGKEGAELLTGIINRFFDGMLDIARKLGGTNVKFGGDALLLLFTGENHAGRAVAAALAMQRATREFASIPIGRERIRLHMRVGIHSGTLWSTTAGLRGRRMQHFILGREASRVAEVEAAARPGEVHISAPALRLVDALCSVEGRGETYRVVRLRRVVTPPAAEEGDALAFRPTADLLAYLPSPVIQRLQSGDATGGVEGEHRKVSLMFIHLLGVNELLEESGPEALLGALQRYVSLVVRLTDRYGGFLAANDVSRLGVKLILIFGAPVAHEQDSANALRLALELNRELPRLGIRLSHRIGINSGFAFAGEVGAAYRREYTVLGDAVNLAARLMDAAAPEQILLSKQVAQEAGPGFLVRDLESITVKGKRSPVPICVLEGERSVIPAAADDERAALVGREAELESFRHLCGEVESGKGRVIVISGEAGMGKSRLAVEFQRLLSVRGWTVLRGQCYPHTAAVPFTPWIHVLNSFFDIDQGDTTEARTASVLSAIERLRPDLIEMAPLLNRLLSLSIPQTDVVRSLNDETRRHRLFDLVAALLEARARARPLAIMIEDIHCADDTSVQLINNVGAGLERAHLLMCLTHRPKQGLQLHLPPGSTVTFALSELPEDAAVKLVQTILDRTDLSPQVVDAILSKTQGNPLFLEQVAVSLRQSGIIDQVAGVPSFKLAEQMATLQLPDRVQALIMSRIDALGSATRDVLRMAAVIGNAFALSTLQSVLGLAAEDIQLRARLGELVQLDFVDREEGVREPSYRFKHALIQEVAYDSLSFARRRRLHHDVASYLEYAHLDQLEPLYEVLTYHYKQSGDEPKLMVYALKAADKARDVFAHAEAIEYYRLCLGAIDKTAGPGSPERSYLFERIGDCYEVSGSYLEAVGAFSRALRMWRNARHRSAALPKMALELVGESPMGTREAVLRCKIGVSCERNSDYDSSLKWLESALRALPQRQPHQAAQIHIAMGVSLFRKGLYDTAIFWGRRGLALSRRGHDRRQRAYAHNMLANSYLEMGNLKQAVRYRHAALRLYDEVRDVPGRAVANNNLGSCYQLLGRLDQALYHYEVSLDSCQRISNVTGTAIVHNNIGEVLLIRGRLQDAIGHFEEVVKTYQRLGSPLAASGLALVNLSRAYQRQRDYPAAVEHLKQGTELLRKAGARGLLAEALIQQAELEFETGQPRAASRTCRRALTEAQELGTKLLETRALRIQGRIALAGGRRQEAENCLSQSVVLAEGARAEYERGLALLDLAQVYGSYGQADNRVRQCRLALRQAISIFRQLGAEGDLTRALHMQAGLR